MKIQKKDLDEEIEQLNQLIDDVVEGKIDIPDDSIIISPRILLQIISDKKIDLIEFIKNMDPKSSQEIAIATKRKKQAVSRDLKVLEKAGILELKKEGRNIIPKMKKKYLLVAI